jgi:hypothetical protein
MAFLFVFAVLAAHFNRRMEAGQSMRLDNLRGHAPNLMSASSPSSGLGNGTTLAPDAAVRPDSQRRPAQKFVRVQGSAESRETSRNPFADLENPFRDPVRDAVAAT